MSVIVFVLTVFVAEMGLRIFHTRYLTYNEVNLGSYVSSEKYILYEKFFFINIQGRKDIHTLEFDPYEERNIASVEGVEKPKETYNELGLRGEVPDNDKKLIITFGDSFTEGACVTIDSSYPKLFEDMVKTIDENFAVLNAGTSGNDPFFDWKMLNKLYKKFNIQEVIFLVNTTDLDDVTQRGGNERFLEDGTLKFGSTPWWERIYAVSYIFRMYVHNILKLDYLLMSTEERQKRNINSIHKIKDLFKENILPFCQENNINLTLAIHPLLHEIENDSSLYHKMFMEFSKLEDLNFVDTFEGLKKQVQTTKTFYIYDGHCTGAGYYAIADEIFRKTQ